MVPCKGSDPGGLGGRGLACWLSQNHCPNHSPGCGNISHFVESKCEMFPSWSGDLGALVRTKLCWGSSRCRVAAPGLVPGGEAAPAPLGQSFVACCYQQFPTRETITCLSLQSRKDLLLFYLAGSVTGIQHELC